MLEVQRHDLTRTAVPLDRESCLLGQHCDASGLGSSEP